MIRRKISIRSIIIVSVILIVLSSTGCLRLAENISSNISFNYPGLRIETLSIEKGNLEGSYPLIVCFGDSVTFGWNLKYEESYPFILEKRLSKEYRDTRVINSGIGGNTTSDAIDRLKNDVLDYYPDIVFINFGLNDGMLLENDIRYDGNNFKYIENDETFYTRLSLESFRSNYFEIIEALREENISVAIMTTNPVLINFPEGSSLGFRKRQNKIYDIFNDEIRKIAEQSDVYLVDIKENFEKSDDLEGLMQPDGIHPNNEGLEKITGIIIDEATVNQLLEK